MTVYSTFRSSSLFWLRALVEVILAQAGLLESRLFYQLALVSATMGFELAELREALVADLAGVRFLARMQAHVLIELAGLRERLATFAALVRLLTCMNPSVLF